eukprot:gene3984-4087_t
MAGMTVFVRDAAGRRHAVDVAASATVCELLKGLPAAAGAAAGGALLLGDAELAPPDALLSDFGVCAEAELHLARPAGLRAAFADPAAAATREGGGAVRLLAEEDMDEGLAVAVFDPCVERGERRVFRAR